jgi:hypothetical protein
MASTTGLSHIQEFQRIPAPMVILPYQGQTTVLSLSTESSGQAKRTAQSAKQML